MPACVPQLLALPSQTPATHADHPQPVALLACQTAHGRVLSHQKPSFWKRRAGAVNVQRNDYGLGLCGQVKSAFLKGNIVPSFERVPSGYTMTEMPRFKVEIKRSTDCLAAVGFERSMNTVPTRSLSNPRIGTLRTLALDR